MYRKICTALAVTVLTASLPIAAQASEATPKPPVPQGVPTTRQVAEGVTEYPSLQLAEQSAEPGSVIAYAPLSQKAVVLEDQDTNTRRSAAARGFSIGCRGDGKSKARPVKSFNAAYLGKTTLYCGKQYPRGVRGSYGYEHISAKHSAEWKGRLTAVGSTTNWSQFMLWATDQAFTHPYYGYPKGRTVNDTLCYSTPIILRTTDGKSIQDFNPTVITGNGSRSVITSYPTRWDACDQK